MDVDETDLCLLYVVPLSGAGPIGRILPLSQVTRRDITQVQWSLSSGLLAPRVIWIANLSTFPSRYYMAF